MTDSGYKIIGRHMKRYGKSWLCYRDHIKALLSKDHPRIFTLATIPKPNPNTNPNQNHNPTCQPYRTRSSNGVGDLSIWNEGKIVGFTTNHGYWTTLGYANSRTANSQTANSRTGHLADWSTRGLDNSQTSQLADWTSRGLDNSWIPNMWT